VAETTPTDPPAQPPSPRRRRRWRRGLGFVAIALIVSLTAAELFLRIHYGLGDPPLSIADPDIEYLFAPSQEVRRLGNRIHYNAYSMRSDDFPAHKSDPRELRVLAIGDSVINGGAQTDQANLATSILQRKLTQRLGRPVIFGNVSASSWGPMNELAYVKKYGLFDADVLLIVVSSHDYADVPTPEPEVGVQLGLPDRKPLLALQEVVVRYLWPRVTGMTADATVPDNRPPEQKDIDASLRALRELIDIGRSNGTKVVVAQHWDLDEQSGKPLLPGHELIRKLATDAGATVVQLGPAFRAERIAGREPMRDVIHPNTDGQRVIAESLFEELERALSGRPATAPTTDATVGQ